MPVATPRPSQQLILVSTSRCLVQLKVNIRFYLVSRVVLVHGSVSGDTVVCLYFPCLCRCLCCSVLVSSGCSQIKSGLRPAAAAAVSPHVAGGGNCRCGTAARGRRTPGLFSIRENLSSTDLRDNLLFYYLNVFLIYGRNILREECIWKAYTYLLSHLKLRLNTHNDKISQISDYLKTLIFCFTGKHFPVTLST